MNKQTLILISLLLLFQFSLIEVCAQSDTAQVRKNIALALDSFTIKKKSIIEPSLKESLANSYFASVTTLRPGQFYDSAGAKALIRHYKTVRGITNILEEWINSTEEGWPEIVSIDRALFIKIYFATKDPSTSPNMPANLPNKYATLFITLAPSVTADIYLNGKFIGTTTQATNGIRMASDKKYALELRMATKVFCKQSVHLIPQERKTIQCTVAGH